MKKLLWLLVLGLIVVKNITKCRNQGADKLQAQYILQQEVENKGKVILDLFDNFKASFRDFIHMSLELQECLDYPRSAREVGPYPKNCKEALKLNQSNLSGIYYLQVSSMKPFAIYCLTDSNNADPWIVVQRNVDGSPDTEHTFLQYKQGFGNLNATFFLGLDKLYALTHDQGHELWMKMIDDRNMTHFAFYDHIEIGNGKDRYALKKLGSYRGDTCNALRFYVERERKISSKITIPEGKCSTWWHRGRWLSKCNPRKIKGFYWECDKQHKQIYLRVAIRPRKILSNLRNLLAV